MSIKADLPVFEAPVITFTTPGFNVTILRRPS
jgi:hypothetical protein